MQRRGFMLMLAAGTAAALSACGSSPAAPPAQARATRASTTPAPALSVTRSPASTPSPTPSPVLNPLRLQDGAPTLPGPQALDGLITALPEADAPATIADSRIVVDGVGFSHIPVGTDDAPRRVLDEVSFVAEPGTVTALVGPSGSGKSTLAKLLCRFWDVEDGSISIGGADLRSIPSQQLMDQIAFVFQETFLFDDTIAGNLRIGKPDATDAEVVAAARAAQAHEFITALPDGYQTRLGERGARLSGGERQRLAIARALLKDAPIVILDEATAYADPENEAALQDALIELIQGRTLVIIAHRLSTISGADQILVLDTVDGGPGTIVERGTHAELLDDEGLYHRMWTAAEATEQVALGDAVHGTDKELS